MCLFYIFDDISRTLLGFFRRYGIVVVAVSIICGLVIYIECRQALNVHYWTRHNDLNSFVCYIKCVFNVNCIDLPSWVIYSLPNALFIFSFTFLMLNIWNFHVGVDNMVWALIIPILGVGSEFAQLFTFIPGVFDPADLVLNIIASTLPFCLIINLKTNRHD